MLFRMLLHQISQPGWTGNLKAPLRTVKVACRTTSSVGSIGHLLMAIPLRDVMLRLFSPSIRVPRIEDQRAEAAVILIDRLAFLRAASCISSPVSVAILAIETGIARLAQCQSPRAFAPNELRCKSRQNRLYCDDITNDVVRERLIRDRCEVERPETSCGTRQDHCNLSVPLPERKQPRGRALETQCDRHSIRFITNRTQDRFRTEQ